MQISKEKLAKLNHPEYAEYQRLLRRDAVVYRVSIVVYFLVSYAVYLGAIVSIFISLADFIERNTGWAAGCIGVVGFYLAFGGLAVVANPLMRLFAFCADRLRHYKRRERLRSKFEVIEKEIEKEAIELLSIVEASCEKRIQENRTVNERLRLKRKWRSEYITDLETVKQNCTLNSLAIDLVDENLNYVKFDPSIRTKFEHFRRRLAHPYAAYDLLLSKIHGLYGRPDSIKLESPSWFRAIRKQPWKPLPRPGAPTASSAGENVLNLQEDRLPSENSVPRHSGKPNTTDSNIQANARENLNIESGDSKKNTSPRSVRLTDLTEGTTQSDLPNDGHLNIGTSGQNTIRRTTPSFSRISRISPELYEKIAACKMNVGLRGELLALAWEKKRVRDEEGREFVSRVEHSSVKIGDGLGYDIRSIKGGKDIYIEVKTTTGDFSSGLFFTRNEYNQMLKLNECYFLYRISRFDLDTNIGDLFIFDGAEKITQYFDFSPNNYVLRKRDT